MFAKIAIPNFAWYFTTQDPTSPQSGHAQTEPGNDPAVYNAYVLHWLLRSK